MGVVKARCVHCRSDVEVEDKYQHGDHIRCGKCGTQHRVVRSAAEGARLVLADVGQLREALAMTRASIARLEDELRGARHSFGIGANGFGIGVAYFLYMVALQDQPISGELAVRAALVAVAAGVVLELANFLFLAKRQAIRRLNDELASARGEEKELQKKLREATRF